MARRSVSNLCRLMGSWISSGSASERTGTENRKWAITAASAWFLSFPSPPPLPLSLRSGALNSTERESFLLHFTEHFHHRDSGAIPDRTRLCGVGIIKLVLRLVFFLFFPFAAFIFSLVLPITRIHMCLWFVFSQLGMPRSVVFHSFHFFFFRLKWPRTDTHILTRTHTFAVPLPLHFLFAFLHLPLALTPRVLLQHTHSFITLRQCWRLACVTMLLIYTCVWLLPPSFMTQTKLAFVCWLKPIVMCVCVYVWKSPINLSLALALSLSLSLSDSAAVARLCR